MAARVPLLGAPSLADSSAEAIDGSTLEEKAAAEGRLPVELQRGREEATRITRQTWAALSRVEQLAVEWCFAKDVDVKRRVKRKKKRRRTRRRRKWLVDVISMRPFVSGSHLFDVGLA